MTKRIFFKGYNSAGKFPDGHIKLDVHFEDSQHNKYVWTPDWEKGTRSFFSEAYRVERLNRPKGPEVEKFKQTAKEVLSREEIESYDEFDGYCLIKLQKNKIIIGHPVINEFGNMTGEVFDEIEIPLSIEFRAKIMEETGNLLNWIKRYKGHSGKWIIVNGELFDVEWEKTKEKEDD